MRIYNQQDYEALLSMLPNLPENASVYDALQQMRNESGVERQPYNFTLTFTAIPAGTTPASQSFLIDSSSPFMLVSQVFEADLAGVAQLAGTQIFPNVGVVIQDQSSNRNWQNAAVPVTSWFGIGQRPYFLPQPRLIPANTTILVTVNSFEAAATPTVRLTFQGYRYYTTN